MYIFLIMKETTLELVDYQRFIETMRLLNLPFSNLNVILFVLK